jgi:hypothetical protein
LKAISPATISILIKLTSEWEVETELRKLTLACLSMSILVLQKTNPEMRQIDLLTVLQMYAKATETLLATEHFLTEDSENFQLLDENNVGILDVQALNLTIKNIESFMGHNQTNKNIVGSTISEAKFVPHLIGIPLRIKDWKIDKQLLGTTLIRTITFLCSESEKIHHCVVLSENVHKLFDNLKLLGKPNHNLVEAILRFAFQDESNLNAGIVGKLIEWIGEMNDDIQEYLSGVLLKKSKLNTH